MRNLRLLSAFIAAALLAACSSGGGSSLPTTTNSVPNSVSRVSAGSDYSLVENGVANPNTHIMGILGSSLNARPMTGLLPYNHGLVETKVKFAVVYWGSMDPNGVQPRLNAFLGAVGGSQWLGTTTQYYQIVGTTKTHITNPVGNFLGAWVDNSTIPLHPTDAQIQAEAAKAATHFGQTGVQVSIIVATEHGHNSSGFGTQYCAYHGSKSGPIVYTNLPYMPDAGANCGANIINKGTLGQLDGVTIVAGHEIAEAQTDPIPPTGWSGNQGEIGDLCAWQNIQNTKFGTLTFPTQPLYSDKLPGCVQ